jgi:hypothetical protein
MLLLMRKSLSIPDGDLTLPPPGVEMPQDALQEAEHTDDIEQLD